MKRATLLLCGALIVGACGGGDTAADSAAAATDSAAVTPSMAPAPMDSAAPAMPGDTLRTDSMPRDTTLPPRP